MTPFEFGQLVGTVKQANALATVAGQAATGAPFRTAARQAFEGAKRVGGKVLSGAGTVLGDVGRALPGAAELLPTVGAGAVAGSMLSRDGKQVEGAGRGAGYAAGAAFGGGIGAGLGHAASRVLPQQYRMPAQMIGGALGTVAGLGRARSNMGPPTKAANALATVAKPLVGEIIKRAPIQAKALPRAAQATAQAGGNAMRYLGAGAAGLAGGVIGSKMMGGKQEQQPKPKVASIAQQPGQNFDPMAMNMGAANTFASQQKPQVPFGTGQQNQKINLGGGKDMLSQGMGALQNSIEAMKKRFPPSHMGSQI